MKRKLLSVFLSLCMIVSCMVGISVTASAENYTSGHVDIENLHVGDTLANGVIIDGIVSGNENGPFLNVNGISIDDEQYYVSGDLTVTGIEANHYYLETSTSGSTHTHDFNFSASGATITATCSGEGDCDYKTTGITLTLNAPTKTTYGDTGDATATLTGLDAFNTATGKTIAATDIQYFKATKSGTTYTKSGSALTGAPTNAGNYLAEITVESKTASVGYTIEKADGPAAPETVSASSTDTTITVTAPAQTDPAIYEYSINCIDWQTGTEFTNLLPHTSYTVHARVAETDNVKAGAYNTTTVLTALTVTINGTPINGKTLTVSVLPANLSGLTYAWYYGADGSTALDNTTNSYTLTDADVGKQLKVVVNYPTFTNSGSAVSGTISDIAPQTITAADVTATYGSTGNAVNASTDGDGTLSYAVTAGTDVVEVDATSGALTILKVGSATVTVTASATDTYAETTKTVAITINPADPSTPTGLTATEGQTLADVVLPTGWTWDAPTTSVGTVGTHTFPASYTETIGNYKHPTAVALTVTVKAKTIPVTGITLDNTTLTLTEGETATLTATVTPDNATDKAVTWSSDKESVATVEGGVVTGVSAGTAKIRATSDASETKYAECTVTVKAVNNNENNGGNNNHVFYPNYTPSTPSSGGNATNTSNTDLTKPVAPDKAAEAVKQATEGSTIKINMGDTTKLTQDVISAVKGKDVNIELDMGNGVKWTINGKDVDSVIGDINMGVTVGKADIPVEVINSVTDERYNMMLSLDHDGPFGFTATLTVQMRTEDEGMIANLFWFDPDANDVKFISSGKIRKNGTVDLEFGHASAYIIIIDDHVLDGENIDADVDAEEDDADDVDDDALEDDIDSEVDADVDGNPGTGVPTCFAVMMIAAAAVAASRKKK